MPVARHLMLPTTVLALLAAPYALAVEDDRYTGTEEAGANKVSLKVKDDKVVKFKATVNALCGSDEDKRTISGKFTGSKVEGEIKVSGLCSYEGAYSARR